MPDFLTQIIRRSTSAAVAVRPRLPSRFESVPEPFGDDALAARLDDQSLAAATVTESEGEVARFGTVPPDRDPGMESPDRTAQPGRSAVDAASSAQPPLPVKSSGSTRNHQIERRSLSTVAQSRDDTQTPAGPISEILSATEVTSRPQIAEPFEGPTKRSTTGLGDASDHVSVSSNAGAARQHQGRLGESPDLAREQERAASESIRQAPAATAQPDQQISSAPPSRDARNTQPVRQRPVVPVYIARADQRRTEALLDVATPPTTDVLAESIHGALRDRPVPGISREKPGSVKDGELKPPARDDRSAAASTRATAVPAAAGPRAPLTAEPDESSPSRQDEEERDFMDETWRQAIQESAMPGSAQRRRADVGRRDPEQSPVRNLPSIAPFVPHTPARGRGRVRIEEKTIQVTIGRIEVRAVTPPPAPVKAKSVPKVMTLDEYLRRKDEDRP